MKLMILLLLLFPFAAQSQMPPQQIDLLAKNIQPNLVEWRRHIHQNPELSNREYKTQAYILAHLKKLGIVTQTMAKTGVVGILKGGKPGPVVALRADMDALPVLERNDLPYKSVAKGEYNGADVPVMHACGHDAHVAILMGAAEVLAAQQKNLKGTVKFIFQPAEEGAPGDEEGGAALMVKEGVMDNPRVDAIFGLHIESSVPEGKVLYKAGAFMAEADWVDIKIKGKQTHGSQPWLGVDPIVISAQIIEGLQKIVSRQQDLTKAPLVITIARINGGVRNNIIPEEVEMGGTIRFLDSTMKQDVYDRIERITKGIAEINGATAEVKITPKTLITYNDEALTKQMIPSLVRSVGSEMVGETRWVTGAEDFSFYGIKAPALFLYYGGMPAGSAAPAPHHTPDFKISDAMLYNGVKILCGLVNDYKKP